jgi:hypothetical protein
MDDFRVTQDLVWRRCNQGASRWFPNPKGTPTGRINPISINKNRTVLTKEIRARCCLCHADATQSLRSLKERATMCVTNGNIIMGSAQTHTMTAIITQAARFPATSHVQDLTKVVGC